MNVTKRNEMEKTEAEQKKQMNKQNIDVFRPISNNIDFEQDII